MRASTTRFETVFERLLDRATATAAAARRGPSEVSWVEQLHNLAAVDLEDELRASTRDARAALSVDVATAFVHGKPFKIQPAHPLSKAVEAGDIMFVGERYASDGSMAERQALLLQMKVGPPRWSRPGVSTEQQALLYGAWPMVHWQSSALVGAG